MRTIVIQYGRRRQYAVPAALARAGALERLYTDACAGRGLGRFAPLLAKVPGGGRARKLAARRPPVEVLERTHTFERWAFDVERALAARSSPEASGRALDRAHVRAGEEMIHAGFGHATHVLSMFGEGRRFLQVARARGLKVVSDVNVALSSEAIVVEAQRRHPDWEAPSLFWGETVAARDPSFRPSEAMLTESDLFLCPSEFVRDDLVGAYGIALERTLLVPYAVNPLWFQLENTPVRGRILFAGTAGLRKGVHVLAEAAEILFDRGCAYEFLMAGAATGVVRTHPGTRRLTFLGTLAFDHMRSLFETADVFALPSLAEGSAGVTYEALGAGVPVVTTRAAGSVVRDGIDGVITQEGNAQALADAIQSIVEDRIRRADMALAARERAAEFTWDAFQGRLLQALIRSSEQPHAV
ncbi:MAG: glycosyltransferase family 4 protein [Hyphomonadaceae bacterium]|nr:glycosyltransferase family 4 protein [Hyphomonadaceae bacterium]